MMRIIRTSRAAVFVRVFQTLEVTMYVSIITSFFIPRTSVFVRIFQTLEVTILGSFRTSIFIPRTSVFVCVFQTLEVTTTAASNKSFDPKDIRFRARISNTRGDHFWQHYNKSFYPKDSISNNKTIFSSI